MSSTLGNFLLHTHQTVFQHALSTEMGEAGIAEKVFVNLVYRLVVKKCLFGKMFMEGRENCQILYWGCLEDIFQGLSQIILWIKLIINQRTIVGKKWEPRNPVLVHFRPKFGK